MASYCDVCQGLRISSHSHSASGESSPLWQVTTLGQQPVAGSRLYQCPCSSLTGATSAPTTPEQHRGTLPCLKTEVTVGTATTRRGRRRRPASCPTKVTSEVDPLLRVETANTNRSPPASGAEPSSSPPVSQWVVPSELRSPFSGSDQRRMRTPRRRHPAVNASHHLPSTGGAESDQNADDAIQCLLQRVRHTVQASQQEFVVSDDGALLQKQDEVFSAQEKSTPHTTPRDDNAVHAPLSEDVLLQDGVPDAPDHVASITSASGEHVVAMDVNDLLNTSWPLDGLSRHESASNPPFLQQEEKPPTLNSPWNPFIPMEDSLLSISNRRASLQEQLSTEPHSKQKSAKSLLQDLALKSTTPMALAGKLSETAASSAGDDKDRTTSPPDSVLWRQVRLRQAEHLKRLSRQIESLRQGFFDLCAAVREDLCQIDRRVNECCSGGVRPHCKTGESFPQFSQHATRPDVHSVQMHNILTAVSNASLAQKLRLVEQLVPELKTIISHEVQVQVQSALQMQESRLKEEGWRPAGSVRAFASGVNQLDSLPSTEYSSPEALDAHIRAVARSVLSEENHNRIQVAADNERQRRGALEGQHQRWCAAFERTVQSMRDEMQDFVRSERRAWSQEELHGLLQHMESVENSVDSVVSEIGTCRQHVADLEQRIVRCLQVERDAREEAGRMSEQKLEKRFTDAWSRLQKEKVEAIRQTERRRDSVTCDNCDAEYVRFKVVQPAVEHMRRLLAAHQKMIDTVVEQRCCAVEQSASSHQRTWDQNIAELREKVTALRCDVRGAFAELCQNLNVASPGL